MEQHKLTLVIDEEQYQAIRKLAYDSHKSIAQIVREAIDRLLEEVE